MKGHGLTDHKEPPSCERRKFLQASTSLPLAIPAAITQTLNPQSRPPKAKSVILLWLWGAPSHVDTWDPKPDAPTDFRGPFSTIATRTPGIHFSELLPHLSERTNLFSLVRSNRTFHSGHLQAGTIGLTGAAENGGQIEPHFGSILVRHQGYAQLPPFISIGRGSPRDVVGEVKGYGGGKWGRAYDPFMIRCSEFGEVDVPSLDLIKGLTRNRLTNRQVLLARINENKRQPGSTPFQQWTDTHRRAYDLLTSPDARRTLDLTQEHESLRRQYGQTSFGQSCLLARRLVEAEVPFVQVNWSQYVEAMTPNCDFGWDTHIYNFEMLADRHCPILDRALSALLDDLRNRGLLETTLVVAMGEFGRTPKINGQAARDHWPNVYSSIWAGGGIQPGRVIGASDRLGQEPISDPVTPAIVGTTMLELAGIHAARRAELNILREGHVLEALL